jgi:hypothetical protein
MELCLLSFHVSIIFAGFSEEFSPEPAFSHRERADSFQPLLSTNRHDEDEDVDRLKSFA